MESALIYLIIFLFVLLLGVNIYFRIKVIRAFNVLKNQRIQFDASLIFQKEKLKTEVLNKYPQQADTIQSFARYLKYSISMAVVLIALITLFGGVLMYYRQNG